MKRVLLVVCTLCAAAFFAACGASNTVNPNPGHSSSFTVTLDQGVGTFTPDVAIATDNTGTVVTITAENASDLAAAYMHLHYDASHYSPQSVVIGKTLGTGDQVISMSLTDRTGEVPIGICQIANNGAMPVNGGGVLATVRFTAQPFLTGKSSSTAPPTQSLNKVQDLAIIGQTATSVTLRWTENHPGDTDNNGEVNLSDMTNIGKHLNEMVADASDPLAVGMADCDGNGQVTVAELTTLGKNFTTVIDGYKVFLDAAGTQAYNNGDAILRANVYDPNGADKNHPVVYVITANVNPAGAQFTVAPADTAAPAAVTPLSNLAQSVVVTGAPDSPKNLSATAGAVIGNGKVRLTWTPGTAGDIVGYEVERQTTTPASGFVKITTVASSAASYIDSDATLTNQSYDYQVRAIDVEGLTSGYAGPSSATPYFLPPPSPPTNLVAITHPSAGQAVRLDWLAPIDGSAKKFNVYRQGPGEPAFTMVRQLNGAQVFLDDTGLTALASYSYYVTALNQNGIESTPTATVSANASDQAQISISAIAIDKTTHVSTGAEPAANVTVTTDMPADVFTCTGPGVWTSKPTGGTWKPNGSTPLGKSTLSIVAHKGTAASFPATVDVFVTDTAILTQFGNNGHFVDFNDGNPEPTMNNIPSVNAPTAPYRKFSYYADGQHVVLFNLWGVWCGPCRAELPIFDKWANHYDGAFWYVGMNCYNGDTLQGAIDYYASQGFSKFENYHTNAAADDGLPFLWHSNGGTGGTGDPTGRDHYGELGYVPDSIIFDRDGNARLWAEGGIGGVEASWNTTISQMTGMTPAS